MNKPIITLILIMGFFGLFLTSCSDDGPKDNAKEITMFVSAETGIMYAWGDDKMENPIECMLVMSDDNPGVWSQFSFEAIRGFSYERGHEYELRVNRTIMANPPADGSDRYYELVRIVSDKLVADPEVPVDTDIRSEADIEYQEGCPINKYSIATGYNVDEDGTITYSNGGTVPAYSSARIWLENILDKADPNWVKYSKASYQATYSYVISPLSDKIRLVRNESHGPMFKNVIPEDEFSHITKTMKTGDELKYTLILANVYKKGLQKLEFTVSKTGELPDKYKFKLVKGTLIPFMNGDFGVPAPFDNISYRITDHYDRFQALGFPEFSQYYDSIVWCADGFPNTERIYERHNSASSSGEHFTSQWSTHFFRSGEVKSQLKGYRNGKVAYSTSLTTYLYERDFLCYDWVEGSFAIANPGHEGIYCLLDKGYEYVAGHTQMKEGTRYAQISARSITGLSQSQTLAYKQDALIKLMTDNVGQGQNATGKTEAFTCLPGEGIEAVKYWENKTTRILLVHRLPDEDMYGEKYYLHFESK